MMRYTWVLVLLFVGVQPAPAQTLSGRVSDPSGAPVPQASVVVSLQTGAPVVASTDGAGQFSLEVPVGGTAAIVVSAAGFADYHAERALEAARVTWIDVQLSVSSFAEDIRVAADLSDTPSASSRLGLTRRQTPASVDVVTQELIQARGADTASTALRYVTGLTSSLRPGASAVFSSRGFIENSVGVLFNGVRVQSSTITMRNYDAFNFDRVEVLRGPASVLHGEGTAAGAINFVRREPIAGRTRGEALVEAGDANRIRLGAAAAGSLGSTSSYSVSFARNQFHTHVEDNVHEYNHFAAAARTAIGQVSLGLEGDWLANSVDDAYSGTPLVNNAVDTGFAGRNFNRSANNRYDDSVGWGRVTATAPLGRRAVYTGQVYRYRADRDWRNSYGFEFLPGTDQVLRRAVEDLRYDHNLWGTRQDVAFGFAAGRRRGRVVIGVEASRTDFSSPRSYGARVAVDASRPVSVDFVAPPRLDDRRADLRQQAVYGEVHLELLQRVTVVAGGRAGTLSNDVRRPASNVTFAQEFSPRDGRAGVVFAATPTVSVYFQHASGSEPIEALLILGPAESGFSLAHTRMWESGVKASVAEHVDLTAAMYQLGKRNLVTTDPEDSTRMIQVGRQSSRGLELAATVRSDRHWLVEANVALLNARYDRFSEGGISRDGNLPPNVPEVVFNAGTTWRPTNRVEAGVWLAHVGRRTADATNTVFQPAYTLVDPFLRVALGRKIDLTLRVRNASNERYVEWATRAFGVTNVYFGEPRRAILSLRLRV